jgi:hypothetical protein
MLLVKSELADFCRPLFFSCILENMNIKTLRGLTTEGPSQGAVVTVGLRIGKRRGVVSLPKKGEVLSPEVAKQEILKLRAKQVGAKAAASTIGQCEGRWMDQPEPTLVCEIKFFPSAREKHVETFERHVGALAENIAEKLGQQEVMIEMGGKTYRANAPTERGPKPLRREGRVIR